MAQPYIVPNIYQDSSNQSQGYFAFRFTCQEQADALQKAWAEIQHEFHLCPKCHRTVCMRCFNVALNLCTGSGCAPDLRADGSHFQHQMNVETQRKQIEQSYQAPQFNISNIPSAVTPAAIAGFSTPGYPKEVMCPTCRRMGPPGKFCQDCGTKLALPDLFCPKCSTPVENGARFCAECGAKLQQAS